ncbi:MAG: A/G-specific adenine glycosylase [Bacteroidales bacterium]
MSYYYRFLSRFPDVESLASAPEKEVMKVWQGLGYYSRARNLHKTAKIIVNELNGRFPETYPDLLKLPGIGPYTAAAIASIVYHVAVPVIDGNVLRFVSRLTGNRLPVDRPEGIRAVKEWMEKNLDPDRPGSFNQAVMEFGALHCTPSSPGCSGCIFRHSCVAAREGITGMLPVKANRNKLMERTLVCLLFRKETDGMEKFMMIRRAENDIWKGLYCFPVVSLSNKVGMKDIPGHVLREKGLKVVAVENIKQPVMHRLTHRQLTITLFRTLTGNESAEPEEIYGRKEDVPVWGTLNELLALPLPKPIEKIVKRLQQN